MAQSPTLSQRISLCTNVRVFFDALPDLVVVQHVHCFQLVQINACTVWVCVFLRIPEAQTHTRTDANSGIQEATIDTMWGSENQWGKERAQTALGAA